MAASAPHCAQTAAEAPQADHAPCVVQARARLGVKEGKSSPVHALSQLCACLTRQPAGSAAARSAPPPTVTHQPTGPSAECTLAPVKSRPLMFPARCAASIWHRTWLIAVYQWPPRRSRKCSRSVPSVSGSTGHGGSCSRPAEAANVGTIIIPTTSGEAVSRKLTASPSVSVRSEMVAMGCARRARLLC